MCVCLKHLFVLALVSPPSRQFEGLVWLCGHRSGDYCKHCNFNILIDVIATCQMLLVVTGTLQRSFDMNQILKVNCCKTQVFISIISQLKKKILFVAHNLSTVGSTPWRNVFLLCLWWFVLLDCKEGSPAVLCRVNAHSCANVI